MNHYRSASRVMIFYSTIFSYFVQTARVVFFDIFPL